MVEDTKNLILRLLRDIRAKQDEHDALFVTVEQRMTMLERKMDDVNECVAHAFGLSAHANIAYKTTGQRLDRLSEKVESPKARIEALEPNP